MYSSYSIVLITVEFWGHKMEPMWSNSFILVNMYLKISYTRCTKSQNLNVSRLVLQLPLLNPLKPGVKLTMKM